MKRSSRTAPWPDPAAAIAGALDSARGMALETASERMDWRDLARRVARLDEGLSAAGIAPGQTVAIAGHSDLSTASAVIALMATRRGTIIVNPVKTGHEMLASAYAGRPSAVLVTEDEPALASATTDDPLLVLTRDGNVLTRGDFTRRQAPEPGDRRLCLFTSGTTGKPKLINISSGCLTRAMEEIAGFNAGFGDRRRDDGSWAPLLQYSPLAHVGGALTLIRAAVQGRGTVMLGKFDPNRWADAVQSHRLLTTGLPPTMMRMVLEAGIAPERLSSLVSVWSGTAPARPSDWDAFTERYRLPILGNYGATEFCGAIAAWSLEDYRQFFPDRRKAVGRIDPRVAFARIRSADGVLLDEPGMVGTLEVKVHRVSNEWLPTSDLASLDSDGFLSLHGRTDEAIMRGGFKLAPERIAAALMNHPAVREATVVGFSDDRLGQVPVAAVEIREGTVVAEDELKSFVRDRLPAYFVPTAIRLLPALPRTGSLKVDRRAVRELFRN